MITTDVRWSSYLQLGRLAYERGWYAIAKKNYTKALTLVEDQHLGDEAQGKALLGLALSCCQLKEFSKAESLFNRLIALSPQQNSNIEYARELAETAVLYQKKGELERSEQLLRQCLEIIETGAGSAIEKAKVLKSLALVYCKKGNLVEAEKLINKAMLLTNTNELRKTRLFAEILGVISLIAMNKGQFAEAEESMDQAVAILEMATGGEHPELADFLQYAAVIFHEAGYPEKALPLTTRANAIRSTVKAKDR